MKKTRIACAAVGAFLVAASLLLALLITPQWIARLPADTHKTRVFEGKFQSLLDPRALASGNLAAVFKTGVPLGVTQDVKVEKTSGDTALVSDTRTTTAAGTAIERTSWQYALDRRSLEAVKNPPSGWTVVPASGLTVSWPIGTDKKTYQGWTPETQTTAPLTYLREESKLGLNAYVFDAKVPPAKIVDSQILATLPKALPKSLLTAFAQSGTVPAAQAQALAKVLPQLSDPVPLSYTFEDDSQFWIEPTTGVVMDVHRVQKRTAELELPGGIAVPLLPVAVVTYQETAATVASSAKDASDARSTLQLFRTILPITFGVVGLVLLVIAALAWSRKAKIEAVSQGGEVPPSQGEVPPRQGEVPPSQGEVPPTQGEVPPSQGEVPPTQGEVPPSQGDVPPTQD